MIDTLLIIFTLIILVILLGPGLWIWLVTPKPESIRNIIVPNTSDHNAIKTNFFTHNQWAEKYDFIWEADYTIYNKYVAIWRHSTKPIVLLCSCFNGIENISISTKFDNQYHVSFTTTDDPNIAAGPNPPGYFSQVFPEATIDDLWNKHLQAQNYLCEKYQLKMKPFDGQVFEMYISTFERNIAFTRQILLWSFRMPYWILTRHKKCNISIQQQDQKQPLCFPNGLITT